MKRRKKILFAAVDIGYRIEHYTKFINEHLSNQLKAESFSKYVLPETHYKTKYTFTCPIDKTHPIFLYLYSFGFFIFSLFRYDIFHFFSGETILTRKLRRFELMTYKLFGKRVVMHFVGSDIRSPKYIYWKEENIHQVLLGIDNFQKTLPWQEKLIQDAEKYADHILVSTPDLLSIIPKAIYYPVLIDYQKLLTELDKAPIAIKKENEIVILHAPSNIKQKGSNIIEKVLLKIKRESQLNIRLVLPRHDEKSLYSVTRYDLFKLYKESDIVIDQLLIGWYGLQSIEALVAGCQVISYIEQDLEPYLFPECPIHNANANTLESVILNCINKKQDRKLNSIHNTGWIKKYHTIENNNEPLLAAWAMKTN